jgi:hypothetical protein
MKNPHQDELIGRKYCGSERRMGIRTHMLDVMTSLSPSDKRFSRLCSINNLLRQRSVDHAIAAAARLTPPLLGFHTANY